MAHKNVFQINKLKSIRSLLFQDSLSREGMKTEQLKSFPQGKPLHIAKLTPYRRL